MSFPSVYRACLERSRGAPSLVALCNLLRSKENSARAQAIEPRAPLGLRADDGYKSQAARLSERSAPPNQRRSCQSGDDQAGQVSLAVGGIARGGGSVAGDFFGSAQSSASHKRTYRR